MFGSIHQAKMVLSYKKKSNIYSNSTGSLVFNPETCEAFSYRWWKFVGVVEGKVVFNNYSYSKSTSKHQYKIRQLLNQLKIKIDLELPLPKGINSSSLLDLILTAEEALCDKISLDVIKAQESYERAKARKLKKDLENYLENEVHFRDYEIRRASLFGSLNIVAVHQKVEKKSLQHDANNAIDNFQRDGFSKIVFYVEGI